jgi:hypothetical protein
MYHMHCYSPVYFYTADIHEHFTNLYRYGVSLGAVTREHAPESDENATIVHFVIFHDVCLPDKKRVKRV